MIFLKKLRKIKNYFEARKYFKSKQFDSLKNIYIMSTPLHTNIGDHAIIQSELIFLHNHFERTNVIEVPRLYLDYFFKKIHVLENDIIALHGGGFFGDLYPFEMHAIIRIIKKYRNKTIVFPQTIYFKETGDLYSQFKEAVHDHGNVTFFAREQKSFDFATNLNIFKDVLLVPDIVLYNSPNKKEQIKEIRKVLLVLRKDSESIIDKNELMKILKSRKIVLEQTDTIYQESTRIYPTDRNKIISDKINQFRNADLIITDRLHGMIFAYISGSFCIALDNITGKSSEVYKLWLNDVDRIKFLKSTSEIIELIDRNSFNVKSQKKANDYNFKPLETIFEKFLN